jgi:outer membrane protein assembly factor BamB
MKRIILAAAVLSVGIVLCGEDWATWRGPAKDSVSKEKINLQSLKGEAKILWKSELGAGYSAVSVRDGRVFTMGNKGNTDYVYCLDEKTGKTVWEYSYPCGDGGGYPGPRCTPVLDGKSVFTLSREGEVSCLDAATGKPVWKKNIAKECGAGRLQWGMASSACIVGGTVVFNAGANGMAFDAATGKNAWENKGGVGNYATPVLFSSGKEQYLAIFGQKTINVVDAKKGSVIASADWQTQYDVMAADPIAYPGGSSIFVSSGYGRGCALFKFGKGKLEKSWENKNMCSHFYSPVMIGDAIYGVNGQAGGGNLACIDAKTGETKWTGKTGFGAFVVADDKIVFLNESGELIVAELSPASYKEITRAKTGLGKTCWTMPVLCNGRLYCRNEKGTLVCVDVK